jgi:hypothetical protein
MNAQSSHSPRASLLDPGYLARLAAHASADVGVAQQATLAQVCIGFHNHETGQRGWLEVNGSKVDADDGHRAAPFCFSGGTGAFEALAAAYPFNRLVREHRLVVEGDLRACVQNWLLIHAILQLTRKAAT